MYDPDRRYRPHDYLADYAKHFRTVEIDQWFWSLFAGGAKLPNPDDVRRYAESIPEDFRFTVKAPNAITLTHSYAKARGAGEPNARFLSLDLLNRFLEVLGPMHATLGPVLFQFEYLSKQKMPSRQAFIDALGAFLDQAPTGFQYAVETRNPNYLQQDFLDLLRSRGVALVLVEGYYMPPIREVADRLDIHTASFAMPRLLGPDRAKIEERTGGQWNEIVEPKDDGLSATAEILRQSLRRDVDTYVNVNNHYEGCAPLTIQRLLKILKQDGAE